MKCQIRQFHVVVVQKRQRNVQRSVMHLQSCCFALLNLFFYVLVTIVSSDRKVLNNANARP